ncbi:MAG: thiamine pyrophosphate-dependent enzyme [Pseudomonadota bacterium]
MFDRAAAIDDAFIRRVKARDLPESNAGALADAGLSNADLVALFDTQLMSRHLDLMARRTKGKTYYSIGSAGHEAMAAVARAVRPDDMAFLHYRDAGFVIERRKAVPGASVLYDMALSFAASADDPVSGGRHKVLGGKDIMVPPQTSTIASHLPKAMGAAHSIGLSCQGTRTLSRSSIVVCSFGDASANHSTAQGAINAACWAGYQGSPMPILFVCEDNDIGISVPTPGGWIEANFRSRPGLHYVAGDGTDLIDTYATAKRAADHVRRARKPAFLHLKTIRLMGHAGADVEAGYRRLREIEAVEARDPLLKTAGQLVAFDILSPDEINARYEAMRARVMRVAEAAFTRPKLATAEAVKASIIPPKHRDRNFPPAPQHTKKRPPDADKSVPMSRHINRALDEILAQIPEALLFGEDVGRKGGVYGVTQGLRARFGPARVMDTLLDEQSILGIAIGAAHNGFLPIPEIQFLAYVHNAEDQLRGEAATLSFFSDGQFTNPMVVRIAGLGYQKGFGGHFHNDNALAVFRDIPGLILACPSSGRDAARMLREAVRLAYEEGRVVVFLEPIALYNTVDLESTGDKRWAETYVPAIDDTPINIGEPGITGPGDDVTIFSYGNGIYLSHQAASSLQNEDNIKVRIVDLRWLVPLNVEGIVAEAQKARALLIVDECRRSGSVSEAIMTHLFEAGISVPTKRINAEDSFIPLGTAATITLPSRDQIVAAVRTLDEAAS